MKTPWIITNFLKSFQYGFYIDINPQSDSESDTKILDDKFKWRGIAINDKETSFNRNGPFKSYILNLNNEPQELINIIYDVHAGTMIHYTKIRNIEKIDAIFDSIYMKDINIPYSTQKIHPHLNFICLEVEGNISKEYCNKLYNYFDLILYQKINENYYFINEVMSYLI